MKGFVACAKESGFYFQCNANSLEGLNGLKRPPWLQRMDRSRQEQTGGK